jgi:hypothetical protein
MAGLIRKILAGADVNAKKPELIHLPAALDSPPSYLWLGLF